jgi:serine/threonine-protein kinase
MADDLDKRQPPPPGAKPADDETRLIPSPGSGDDETRLISSPGSGDDETRLIPLQQETRIIPAEAPAAAASVSELKVGSNFAGFQVLAEIARGEMGIVYRARRLSLERIEALKVIAPRYAEDPDFRARFRREALNAAITRHPHIVDVYDADERDGHLFIAMQYVDGTDLRHRLMSGPLPPDDAVEITRQLASALDAAHAGGVIHRDVKPGNVLLRGDPGSWYAFLSDFGVSRQVATSVDLTHPGSFVGTPSYTAPQQQLGQPADRRSDVYSLACVLYEMLTGHKPYQGDSVAAMAVAHVQHPIPELDTVPSAVALALGPVLRKALAKDPDERFQTAGELASAAGTAWAESESPAADADQEEVPEPHAEADQAPALEPLADTTPPTEPLAPSGGTMPPTGSTQVLPPSPRPIAQPPTPPRSAAARRPRAAIIGQLIAIAGCIAVVLIVRLVHRYIDFGNGMESLWDATRQGGDPSSTHTAVDFRNLIIPVAVAFGLIVLSMFVLRRLMAFLAMLAGLAVIGQILRFRLGLGLGAHWQKPHAVGVAYWLSLGAAALIVAGAALAAAARRSTAPR